MEIWSAPPGPDAALWPPGGSEVIAYEDPALDVLWNSLNRTPAKFAEEIRALAPEAGPMLALLWLNLAKACLLDAGDLTPPRRFDVADSSRWEQRRSHLDGLIAGVGATGDTPILTTGDLLARLDLDDETFDEYLLHIAIRARLTYGAAGGSRTLRLYTRALRRRIGAAVPGEQIDTLAYIVLTRATRSGRVAMRLGANHEQRARAVLDACMELMAAAVDEPVTVADVRPTDSKLVADIGWDARDIGVRLALVNTMLGARRSGRIGDAAEAVHELAMYGTRYYGVLLHLLCGVLADALERDRHEHGLPELADPGADHRGRG